MLQILDEGRLTDGHGRTVDFRNTVIIMTSNLGTQYLSQGGAWASAWATIKPELEKTRKDIEGELRRTFRPEFLNRIDDTIVFQALSREEVLQIVDLEVRKVAQRISEKRVLDRANATSELLAGRAGLRPAVRRAPAQASYPALPGESAIQALDCRRVQRRRDRAG